MSGSGKKLGGRWGLDELVALECALARDEGTDWNRLKEEDAAYRRESAATLTGDRRNIVLSWLRHRLKQVPEIRLAADSVMQSLKVAGQLVGAAALLLGLGAATGALAYNGEAPINVSAFFSVFVLLQGVLAALLLLIFVLPRAWRERLAFGPVFKFGRWVLGLTLARLQSLSGRFLSGQQRQDAAEWAGAARRGLALHGSVAKWVSFVKLQAAALCFSAGALIALLVAVVFSDRAFGWQTTLEVDDAAVFELVKVVATPWAWQWGEGYGFPDRSQIAGSRIVLKDGIQELVSQDLAAWWRFLALGILTYGVLPRLAFFGLGKWQLRASLAGYDFRNASAERLVQRLVPAESRFDAEKVEQGSERTKRGGSGLAEASLGPSRALRFLYSVELGEAFDVEALRACLADRWKLPSDLLVPVVYRDGLMGASVDAVEDERELAIVFESWMPPIRELERQLKDLRQILGTAALMKIVLIGIPGEGEAISLKPEKQYAEAWNSFVRRIGDPYMVLENPAV